MNFTRRDMGRLAFAAAAGTSLRAAEKPNSNFGGVQVGVITYSFRELPGSAEEVLGYCLKCGINAIELMSTVPEGYAGAPLPKGPFGPPPGRGPGGPGGPGGRPAPTPEQLAAREKAEADLKSWRLATSMEKYRAFRKMYNDAGVSIYAFKLEPRMSMSDAEYDYIWTVAETMGANHITMELPTDDALLNRVAGYAAKRRLRIAFHTHGQGGSSGFEKALGASPYTALNLDIGHYFGVTGQSPLPLIEKYHDRIASLHMKDRKAPEGTVGGPNMPWGQGGTPLKEVLQLMKAKQYKFPATIEYEYRTPEGSDVVTEVGKCVEFCRRALV